MLHGMTIASPPFCLMPAATASQASVLRLDTTTLAPSSAQCSAIERPMPRLEPVTMATLFSSPNGDMVLSPDAFREAFDACRWRLTRREVSGGGRGRPQHEEPCQ